MRYGALLLLNEIDLTSPEIAAGLNSVLDGSPLCIAENGGELIVPHPMAIELANSSVESSSDALTVAVEGTRQAAPLPAEQKLQALQASIALRTRLQGFLQAQTQRRCSIGRRGTLHANSLYRLQVGNARVFQKESEQQGLNTAVHILLDASGSMSQGRAGCSPPQQICPWCRWRRAGAQCDLWEPQKGHRDSGCADPAFP